MKKESSLGQDLILENSIWTLDLSELKIFTGLSILSQILGDQILEKVEEGVGDISFLYKLNQNINPELIEMQIAGIQVICHSGVLDNLILFKTEFHNQLRTIFGTFQRPVWAKKIHPEFYNEDNHTFENQALVFSFENENRIYFILERSENARYPNKFYFRLSILKQNPFLFFTDTKRLHLVNDIHSRTYIAGTTKLSESTAEKVLNSVQKNLNAFIEENTPHNSLFQQIEKTHLSKTDQISFYFAQSFIESIQLLSKYEQVQIYKKIFLALEDEVICGILNREEKIKIITNKNIHIYLFLTRRCKILNLSFNEFKKTESLEDYLVKMPILHSISKQEKSFKGFKVFLIHHITSEILAVIESIQKLQASSLQVMFVKYAGKIPDAYLDTLLNVQSENFFMAGLTRHLTDKNREYFTLAKYYSDIKDFQWLEEKLNRDKLNFYEAMKYISMYFFLLYLLEAKKEQRKVLLIEDGGYLAPNLNEFILKNKKTSEIFSEYNLVSDFDENFESVIKENVIGTIEHTRNGLDRLLNTQKLYSDFKTVTYSIAISNQKVIEESKEVAHSILSAIESVLHGQGMILSTKKIIILGALGNIGGFLSKYLLGGRLHDQNLKLVEVDLKFIDSQYRFLGEIPEEDFLNLDFFIGVIGESILKKEFIEKILLHGKSEKLFFASGSTKTVEFSDLSEYLYNLSILEKPNIQGNEVSIQFHKIFDPQTLMIQGTKVTIQFLSKSIVKTLYLLGDLSPINFLYYGVPTEMMDKILSQLIQLSLGLAHQYKNQNLPKAGIYAVDKEINEFGEVL